MSINERKGRANGQKDSEADASQKDNVVMETVSSSDSNGGSSKFIVRGHIVDKPSGKAASDVRVQAFVKHKESNFCPEGDSTQSDAEGFYQIEFSAATFKENDLECDGPVLVVKAYNQKDSLIGKSKSVRIVNRETELNVDVTLYRVNVSVLDVNNKPVPKIIVKAFDRDLRKPQPLGACETNEQGKCYIDYSLVDFQKGDLSSNKTPWLIVEARKEPDGAVLVSQEFRKAESIQKVNLAVTIPGTVISEWQRLNNIIPPLLKGQGTPPSTGSQSEMDNIVSLLKGQCTPDSQSEGDPDLEPFDLTSTDIDFIVLETELDRAAVEAWVASSIMVRDAILLLTDAHPCEQAIIREQGWPFFYSFARQGFANDLEAVLRESAIKWERAWRAALSNDQVPPLDEEHLKQLVTILELLQRLRLLDPVQSRDSSIVQVLAQTPLPAAVALDALTIFQERGLSDTAAFLKLIDSHPNAETDIKIFVRGVRIHQLVSGHAGLSRLLNSHLDNTNGSDTSSCCFVSKLFGSSTNFELDSIGPLALLPSTEWITLGEKASVNLGYAIQLQAEVEHMHPLTALQARITKEDVQFPVPRDEIMSFIKKNEETAELILQGAYPLKDLKEKPIIYKMLSNVGLFQRLGLNMESAARLMENGIESPGAAVGLSEEIIQAALLAGGKYTEETAREVSILFSDFAGTSLDGINNHLTELMSYAPTGSSMQWSLGIEYSSLPLAVRENFPDLTNLFGDMDECFCRPCESMLSQSAYLVDLLNLLKKQTSSTLPAPNTASLAIGAGLIELNNRRSPPHQITTLPLSCESAENEIQHIVLVLEILADAIKKDIPPYTDADLQTASAVFPWRSLPYDPFYEKAKAYLKKLNVARYDLRTLQADANKSPLSEETEIQLVAETLGLTITQTGNNGSVSEWELVTKTRSQDALWQTYGFPGDGNVSIQDPASGKDINESVQLAIRRISVLLDRTGLDLDQLEEIITTTKDPAGNPITKFVSGPGGFLTIENRDHCKTSDMRLNLSGTATLEACLDRLHRFIRLQKKLPEWSFARLDQAIVANGNSLDKTTVGKLAAIKRLNEYHKLPLEYLLRLPDSENKLRQALELSAQQYILVKAMTGLDLSVKPTDWNALEKLCITLNRLRESGLTVEQVAAAVLPQETLKQYLPLVKTSEQIEGLLEAVQQHLRSVEAFHSGISLEEQATEALIPLFDATTANKLTEAIKAASEVNAIPNDPIPEDHPLLLILFGPKGATLTLGEWRPLLPEEKAREILTVVATGNHTADERFELLLEGIELRRHERELVAVITEQCGLPVPDAIALLSSRMHLDPVLDTVNQINSEIAAEVFLNERFWKKGVIPSISEKDIQRLQTWMDRLFRLVTFSQALKLDSQLMQFVDRLAIGNRPGIKVISWRDMLATAKSVDGVDFHALLDFLWLQRAEQLSKAVLDDLFNQLDQLKAADEIKAETLQTLATRVGIPADQTLAITKQAISPLDVDNLRDPSQLRRAFELLLRAQHLGANSTELQQLADLAANKEAATTAPKLLQAHVGEEDWPGIDRKINDPLLQRRRDALVDYLVDRKKFRNANDLYEHYLIDSQIESCLITTRLLEAITATQLFIQRILFGLEPKIKASSQLKNWWVWMRNYRVWEANRKVFLFPENWLFPELRDDKSSSFKQLESTLGQSELTQDLARQAYGEFLDDVAQMGQIQVLGMYEDISRDSSGAIKLDQQNRLPLWRKVYVIGRTINPPYAYFWRSCVDFGSELMEWLPWQRIELDIIGDHVLPFAINQQLVIIWPLIKRTEQDSKGESTLEINFSWSRYNGVKWSQPKKTRDALALARAEQFDERQGVHFEGFVTKKQQQADSAIQHDLAILNVFVKPKYTLQISLPTVLLTDIPSPLLAFGSYTTVARYVGDGNFEFIDNIPADSLSNSSAKLEISWSCWIRVKKYETDPNPGYLKLASSSNRSITLSPLPLNSRPNSPPFNPLSLGETGAFLCVDFGHLKGSLPFTNWRVWATFNGTKTGINFFSNIHWTSDVYPGELNTAMRVFVIEASDYTVADLGLEDLATSKFERKGSFEISTDETFRSSSYQIKLMTPVSTECWMNGFIESNESSISDFAVKLPVSKLSEKLLGSSKQNLFYEVIPAISNCQSVPGVDTELLPRLWYYHEGQASTYIDVVHEELNLSTKFCLYPSGFSEAIEYSSIWRNSNTIAVTENQGGLFDAQLLPLQINDMDRRTIRLEKPDGSDINKSEQRKLSFDNQFPNACYNWEVFFHAPLLIADQLSKQLKFMDAEQWLRYVFDPTSDEPGTDPRRFFNFRVFRDPDLIKPVIDDLTALAQAAGGFATTADIEAINKLIDRWRDAPFRPFLIARRRYIAFLWRTLFAYLDNLIAWADSLYRRDTRESLNEATMLYILAERILGRRPQQHPGKSKRHPRNYNEVLEKWDSFANFWVNVVSTTPRAVLNPRSIPIEVPNRPKLPTLEEPKPRPSPEGMLYFCMPFNDKITSYWNIIDERLFNLRHCRNIEGIERSLPLTDAPIDPELLIRATAAGLNLGDVISGLYAPPPHYRYAILSARAAELANEVKSLGAAMLSAIEKRDAEQIAQLRSSNEIDLLRLVREVRTLQITEAESNRDALLATRMSTGARYDHYQRLLGKKGFKVPEQNESVGEESMLGNAASGLAIERSNWGLIKEEDEQYVGFEGANTWSIAAGIAKAVGGASHAAAAIALFANWMDPTSKAYKGLQAVGQSGSAIGDGFSVASQAWRAYAEQQGMMAGHIRRRDEWAFQSNQVLKELQQIDKQILANKIRIDITSKELSNQIEQIEQAKAVDEVMRSKFSNEQLYQWMISQLSGLYFNTYRMALDMARRAERGAERELGVKSLNVLRNDYWDSLRVGLLAGERLHLDIKRLEVAYLDQNRREYELTKHISLRRLNPGALVNLRIKDAEGHCSCEFDIPEWLFDLDTPGHYLRRIKSVSVSIPCVAGPYTNVSCKLTLLKSSVRFDRTADNYSRSGEGDDPHFIYYFGASEAIVTSTGNADSGMFDPQLKDERFLTFESSGVISSWRLELPAEYPQFDYSTISDVILTIRYTARDGGDLLRKAATTAINTLLTSTDKPQRLPVLLSCRSDFSTEWAKARSTDAALKIKIKNDLLPYWMEAAKLKVQEVSYADLFKESTEPLHFETVWSQLPEPESTDVSNTPATIDVGEVDLGKLVGDVTDRLVLLWVGK